MCASGLAKRVSPNWVGEARLTLLAWLASQCKQLIRCYKASRRKPRYSDEMLLASTASNTIAAIGETIQATAFFNIRPLPSRAL